MPTESQPGPYTDLTASRPEPLATGFYPPMPARVYASPTRPTEPTAGGEELARLEHLAATILEHTGMLEARLERILAQPAPSALATGAVDRPARSDGAPGSPLAEQLHELNDRLALVARRLAELGDRIDV